MKSLETNAKRKVEVAAYVLLGIATIAVNVWLVKPRLFKQHANATTTEIREPIQPGTRLGQPSDWHLYDKTVLLALQKGCGFCAASAPFYRRLSGLIGDSKAIHLTAVLPQTVGQARQYLAGLGIPIADVRQASLLSLRITGTPTVLLVDSSGVVKKVWVGQLKPEGEAEVLRTLGLRTD